MQNKVDWLKFNIWKVALVNRVLIKDIKRYGDISSNIFVLGLQGGCLVNISFITDLYFYSTFHILFLFSYRHIKIAHNHYHQHLLKQKILVLKNLRYFTILNGIDLTIGVGAKWLGVNLIKTHQLALVN